MAAKQSITLKGRRSLWLDFVYEVKKNKSQVWDELKIFLEEYIKKSKEKREEY